MHSSRMHTARSSSRLLEWGGWGACLSACWDTHHLPGCGPGDPPGVGLETPSVWAWRPPRGPGGFPNTENNFVNIYYVN